LGLDASGISPESIFFFLARGLLAITSRLFSVFGPTFVELRVQMPPSPAYELFSFPFFLVVLQSFIIERVGV